MNKETKFWDKLLGEMSEMVKGDYDRDYSHTHCWKQEDGPACGQPLENHKQCCLCDTPYSSKKPPKGDKGA